jgi:3',5'-cyclic AMP phosphodiesterase CpdA
MPQRTQLRTAIISDMHCHDLVHDDTQESYLMAGDSRIPEERHPVAALLKLIRSKRERSDIVVAPGDLANKMCRVGLTQSWDYLGEVKRALHARLLLVTLGNHDVDSHKLTGRGPFEVSRSVSAYFPLFSAKERDSYWSNGFAIVKRNSRFIFLIINSVLDHTDIVSAKRGSFNPTRLSSLEEALSNIGNIDRYPIRMAVLHHHPILHTIDDMGPNDVLAEGDQLLDLLSRYGFVFVIHGHKHFPRILRYQSMFVLAAGSFSAYFKKMGSRTRNLFHILELSKDGDTPITGELKNYEFNWGMGWNPTSTKSSGFPSVIKISQENRMVNHRDIVARLRRRPSGKMTRDELFQEFPSLEFYLPDELAAIDRTLRVSKCKIGYNEDGLIIGIARI